jgi:hypothetical protein
LQIICKTYHGNAEFGMCRKRPFPATVLILGRMTAVIAAS